MPCDHPRIVCYGGSVRCSVCKTEWRGDDAVEIWRRNGRLSKELRGCPEPKLECEKTAGGAVDDEDRIRRFA